MKEIRQLVYPDLFSYEPFSAGYDIFVPYKPLEYYNTQELYKYTVKDLIFCSLPTEISSISVTSSKLYSKLSKVSILHLRCWGGNKDFDLICDLRKL